MQTWTAAPRYNQTRFWVFSHSVNVHVPQSGVSAKAVFRIYCFLRCGVYSVPSHCLVCLVLVYLKMLLNKAILATVFCLLTFSIRWKWVSVLVPHGGEEMTWWRVFHGGESPSGSLNQASAIRVRLNDGAGKHWPLWLRAQELCIHRGSEPVIPPASRWATIPEAWTFSRTEQLVPGGTCADRGSRSS